MPLRIPAFCSAGIVGALLVAGPRAAAAGGPDASMFSFGAFGTLGVVHSSEHQADFSTNQFKPNGAGYTHDWSASVDSVLAAQVTAELNRKLSAVVQLDARQNADGTYWPQVEWADIKYQFTPEFSARLGRTLLPSFLVSDARNIGYANPWVRPPGEVYGLVPITSSDGADVSYRLQIGDVIQTFVGTYGTSNRDIPPQGTVQAKRNWLIADTIEYGPATVHIAYEQGHNVFKFGNDLFAAFREFGPQGNAIADKYDWANKLAKFVGLGASYDPGKWFVKGEWGRSALDSVLGTNTGWYVSGGYQLATFTPYLTYARANADNLSDPGLTVTGLPAGLAGAAGGLNAALNSILSSKVIQRTISVGGRWDFMKNADLKLQFDHTRIGAGSTGSLNNIQPGFRPGGEFNLLSITFDFVY